MHCTLVTHTLMVKGFWQHGSQFEPLFDHTSPHHLVHAQTWPMCTLLLLHPPCKEYDTSQHCKPSWTILTLHRPSPPPLPSTPTNYARCHALQSYCHINEAGIQTQVRQTVIQNTKIKADTLFKGAQRDDKSHHHRPCSWFKCRKGPSYERSQL